MNIETGRLPEEIWKQFEKSKSAEVIERLENSDFSHSPLEFLDSLLRSHHLLMLTVYSVEELSQMEIYKVRGYFVGFAIKTVGEVREIVGVHNNEFDIHGLGRHIIKAAIGKGGNALDHFGSDKLNELYASLGFVEVSRVEYDDRYDPDHKFLNTYGPLPVIYRVLSK